MCNSIDFSVHSVHHPNPDDARRTVRRIFRQNYAQGQTQDIIPEQQRRRFVVLGLGKVKIQIEIFDEFVDLW